MDKGQAIIDFVKEELKDNADGHGYQHAERVVKNAQAILAEEGGDAKIVETACWLHDTVDHKLFADLGKQKDKVRKLLEENGYDEKEIAEIIEIVSTISFDGGRYKELTDHNAMIVRDADRLDAMGAIGIIRTIEYGTSRRRPFYEAKNLKKAEGKIAFGENSETSLSHFYEKLLLLKNLMCTSTGRRLAQKRHAFMLAFLQEFYEEIE